MGSEADNAGNATPRSSLNAVKWNYAGNLGRAGIQFVIGIVLARLLGPEPFGLVAVASLILGLGALFADFGLASALVQRKDITTHDVRYVFTLQALFGLLLTLGLELFTGPIAAFFKRPDAVAVLHAMFLMFVIQGLGQTSFALLRRRLDFKLLQMSQLASYIIGYVAIGLPLAFMAMGVWSLVLAQLSQTMLATVIAYALVRHSILPTFKGRTDGFLQFGLTVTLTNLNNWGLACLDTVVIGRMFPTAQLGLYNRAFSLVAMPAYNIVSSIQNVLFSASARMQDDRERLRRTYLTALGVIGLICLPMFLVVAAVARTMIAGVYGTAWLEAVPILVPIALAMPFSALMGLGGPVMSGAGRADFEMRIQFVSLLAYLPLLYWAAHLTIVAVAWAVLTSYLLRFFLVTSVTLRLLQARWTEVLTVLAGPLALGALCAALAYAIDLAFQRAALPPALQLLVIFVSSACSVVALLLAGQRWILTRDMAQLLAKAMSALPRPVRHLIVA